jgi:GntR family transcriptional repressor for pyruvate dehydrogenase complex
MTKIGPPLTQSQGLSELITDRLLSLMRSGHLAEGSKLPPERELAEMLGVSRTMVREALAALQLAGLVERRPGLGTVIVRTPAQTIDLDNYIEASASIAQLIEARLAVELGIVNLLCDQREYDYTKTLAHLDAMRLAVRLEHSAEHYILPSLDFHLELARATEQPVVSAIAENLIDLMRPHLWLLIERYSIELAQDSLALHERMFGAVQARDVIAAMAEVRRHYMPYPVLTVTSATRAGVLSE